MKNFISVSTNSARFQDISLNPQKLAGMCAKLKCCLNYEVDDYVEAGRRIPSREVVLQTLDGDYYLFKTDILAGMITYSTDKNIAANLETITAERARLVIEMNKNGEKPATLHEDGKQRQTGKHVDLLAGENISRFDKAKKKKKKKKPQEGAQPKKAQDGTQPKKHPEGAQTKKPQAAAPKKTQESQPKKAQQPQPKKQNAKKQDENA